MFNERLRQMRMTRSLTQQKFADKLGVALRSYQCYETGTRRPSYELLVQIADILNVSTDFLLCRDDFLKSYEGSSDGYR